MKRIIALALTVSLFFVAVTACSAGDVQTLGATSPNTQVDTQERVKFEFFEGLGSALNPVLYEIADDFNAMQNTYLIEIVSFSSYDDAFRGYQAASAAKQPPALVMGGFTDEGIKNAVDVSQFVDEDPDFSWNDYIDVYVDMCNVNGKMLGLPLFGGGYILFYDKHKVAELGLDPDLIFADWQSVAKMSADVTQKDTNGNVTYWGFSQLWYRDLLHTYSMSNGGELLSEDGKTVTVNTREWVEPWELIRKMIHEDEIMQLHHGGEGWEAWYKTLDDVLEGRALACIGSSGDLPYVDWDIVDAHIPPSMEGKGFFSAPIALNAAIIPATASVEQQRGAFAFYKYMTSPENAARWCAGVGTVFPNKRANDMQDYQAFLESAPYFQVLFDVNTYGQPVQLDPTNGKIYDALAKAYDQIVIEGISAQQALDNAAADGQRELDLIS